MMLRHHALPETLPADHFGAGGVKLRELIASYDHETVHPVAKATGMNMDFFTVSLEPRALLAWWGDLSGARDGWCTVGNEGNT